MKPRDRVAAALAHEEPDRCPFQASFTPEFAARLRQEPGLVGPAASAAGPETGSGHNPHGGGNPYDLEIALGEDMLITSVGWANCYYLDVVASYVDEWGVGWRPVEYSTPYGKGRYTEIAVHPLADDAAIDRYEPPDPDRPELYEAARRAVSEHGGEHWIAGATVTTVFECAWALRGLERLLLDLVERPGLASRILDIPYRYHLAAARRLAALGVDMIWIGDDFGTQSGMMISPRLWREHFKPRLSEFIGEVKGIRPGLKVAYHSDGAIRPIVPDLVEVGVDILNPVQPGPLDPAELKREFGDRLSFWGSIDEQRTLPFGTPGDVRREVLERLRTIGKGGGLIVGPTHHVQLDTPMENFRALVETATGTAYASLSGLG